MKLSELVTDEIMMNRVNLQQAAQEVLKQNGLTDWTVEADAHELFKSSAVIAIVAGGTLLDAMKQLANHWLAQLVVDNDDKKVVFLPNPYYVHTEPIDFGFD